MNQFKWKSIPLFICTVLLAILFSSCYETHYYHQYHHHTHGWYDRHHTPPPAGVNFEMEIHN